MDKQKWATAGRSLNLIRNNPQTQNGRRTDRSLQGNVEAGTCF